jgi:hypothetical protein
MVKSMLEGILQKIHLKDMSPQVVVKNLNSSIFNKQKLLD